MKNSLKLFTVVAAALVAFTAMAQDAPKGHLMIIGGGNRSVEIMQQFVDLAGGQDAKFLVISTAGLEQERGSGLVKELNDLGCKKAQWIAPTREECNSEKYVKKMMKGVTGVFFTGGLQSKIVDTIGSTLLHEQLRAMYAEGGIIGGTSAGAAMMSDPMIGGGPKHKAKNEKDKDKGFTSVEKNNVKFSTGMGFLPGVVIDQHFFKRSRENRLFSAALDRPQYVYIGIDEATGLLVSNGNEIEIIGDSNVLILEPEADKIKTDAKGHYAISDMTMRLLVKGDKYVINR